MKTICFAGMLLIGYVSVSQAQGLSTAETSIGGNGKYISFKDRVDCNNKYWATRCLTGKEFAWQRREIAAWKSAIRKAADILPEEFFRKTGKISWQFFINRDDWATAYAGGLPITVNLLSNYTTPPEWLTWEPFRKNGLTESERVFVALHEMAHISCEGFSWSGGYFYRQFQGIVWWNEGRLENVGSMDCSNDHLFKGEMIVSGQFFYRGMSFKIETRCRVLGIYDYPAFVGYFEKDVDSATLYGKERGENEGFADEFALFVMWPEYLKNNFLDHYQEIKKILGREYESRYPMPDSIRTRLTVK